MSVFQSKYTRALKVIPSDDANVPYPNLKIYGVSADSSSYKLSDGAADFILNGVAEGDIVYNNTNEKAATVLEVLSATELLLNADIFPSSGYSYSIYNSSSQTSNGNSGCYLYIGGSGKVDVTTIGGDRVIFYSVPVGTTLPIQVVKVHNEGTVATEIIALW